MINRNLTKEGLATLISKIIGDYLGNIKSKSVKIAMETSPELKQAKRAAITLEKELYFQLVELHGDPVPDHILQYYGLKK